MRPFLLILLLCQPALACPSCTFYNLCRSTPVLLPWLLTLTIWVYVAASFEAKSIGDIGSALVNVSVGVGALFVMAQFGLPAFLLLAVPVVWWCYYALSNLRARHKSGWQARERAQYWLNHATAVALILIYLTGAARGVYLY